MDAAHEIVRYVSQNGMAKSQERLTDLGFDPVRVRDEISGLAQSYGSPALDIGTGACSCMAVALAGRKMQLTAVDSASGAIRIAQERAIGARARYIDIRHVDASQMPFADGECRVTTASDLVCHAARPADILGEMLRVSSRAVIITGLNASGREITHHLDGGFQEALPDLLSPLCRDCRVLKHRHDVTYVCERLARCSPGSFIEEI